MDYTKYIDQGILVAQEFIKANGQTAWDTVLLLVSLSAYKELAWGFVGLIAFVILLYYSIINTKRMFRMIEIEEEYCNTSMNSTQKREKLKAENLHFMQIVMMVFQVFGLIATFLMSTNLLTMWVWIQAFYPELWLAKQAVEKVLN